MAEDIRILISYARRDGSELAQRLQASLQAYGFDVWLDTERIKGGAVWSTDIERAVDTRPLTLALLSPGSDASEICRAEQLRALDKGNRVIPVLAAKGANRPVYLYARQYLDFSNPADYEARFAALVANIRSDDTATLPDQYRQTPVTYLTAPPRVANYLERRQALDALRDTLFAEDHRQPIALTAVAGMGGIGKTVLAKALTDDPVVRRAFPDGIVWITAGKERKRDFIDEMREVAKALGDDPGKYENELACRNQYRTTIANKAALIVVDDVWSTADIEPLLAESARSRFLFTTRDQSIGRFVGAQEHQAGLLDPAQGRKLLASWAQVPADRLPPVADDLVTQCGFLPLAISVTGAMLRGAETPFWNDTLELLRKADLKAIEDQLPDGQQSFFKAVEVSFQSLKPEMQERYKILAVLLEDMPAPLPILQTLWNTNDAEARRISRHFVDRSLAQRDGDGVRLHDLQLDYVRALFPDRDALELIVGAMRLSAHVLARDPRQFASQLLGRLLPHLGMPGIRHFVDGLTRGAPAPWLQPVRPALHPPGTALIRTLAGHSWSVNGIALSADGRCAVSASEDKTLKVWDVESGRLVRTLKGHSEWVNGVALSADGRRAVSASRDTTLKVWDVESGRLVHTLEGHSAAVNGVALSADGRRAVSASWDKTLKVWDVESGRLVHTMKGHSDRVNGVALTGDGRRAVSASWDKTLKVWNVERGRLVRTLEGHSEWVNGVALSADGRRAVSASWDKTLKVWDVESGRLVHTLEGHSGGVNGVALSGVGRRAVSASDDAKLKVWDVESGGVVHTLEGHSAAVMSIALSPDGRRAVSASWDKTLKVWDVESGGVVHSLEGHSGTVTGVALSADGRRAVSSSWDMTLKVWDVESGGVAHTLEGHFRWVNGVALSADGRRAVSASWDMTLKVWDVESGRLVHTLEGHSDRVNGVALSADGRRAVSASWDKTLKVWDVESGRLVHTLEGHSGKVDGVALSADGRRAVSASWDKTLKVWDVESGRLVHTLEGHSREVNGVALTGDGRRAVSASWDMTLKVWDVERGRLVHTLEGHSAAVYGVALSADGRRGVSASWDRTLKVWDLETTWLLATFTCDAEVYCCAFMSATALVAGDALGRVHWLKLVEQ
jgi:WD40 repeat protein